MVKKVLLLMFVSLFLMASSVVWAGENSGATVALEIELKAQGQSGCQGYWNLKNVGPEESIILSIYGRDVQNLGSYEIRVKFEPDKVALQTAGFSDPDWDEDYLLEGTGAFTIKKADPANPDSVYMLSAASIPASEEDAPDGTGLLCWLEFKTKPDFSTATEAIFTLVKADLIGFDGETDSVVDASIEQNVGKAYVNGVAVEPTSWGQIKALFK